MSNQHEFKRSCVKTNLSALEMGVARHDIGYLRFCSLRNNSYQILEVVSYNSQFTPKPETQICGNLIITTSTPGRKFSAESNPLSQMIYV
jgi:hypothetical protein